MACTYGQLLHDVALRMNALIGAQADALNTTYLNTSLTADNFKSADFPFASFKDAILMAEEDFCAVIAETGNHPFRRYIGDVTASLADKDFLPSQSAGSTDIIGTWGAVYDASDNNALVEMPLDVILRRTRNANTHYVCPVYYYKIDGGRIYHTRIGVKVECCVYNRTAQATAFDNNTDMLLPDVLEPAIAARAISLMTRDNAYADQAAVYRNYSDDAVAAIRGGEVSVPAKSVPTAITNVRAN